MPSCFQLLRAGIAIPLQEIDEEMCRHFKKPIHEACYYEDWYDTIGHGLAAEWSFDQIRSTYSAFPRLVEVANWIEANFTVRCWYERKGYERDPVGLDKPPEPWTGPVVIVRSDTSRVIGPFPNVSAATTWLRKVPNALFSNMADLESARVEADVFLVPLEPPATATQVRPSLEQALEWDLDWSKADDDLEETVHPGSGH